MSNNSKIEIQMLRGEPVVVESFPDGTYCSRPITDEPYVIWKHVDGPLLICRDGTEHSLNWRERFFLWVGFITIKDIEHSVCRVNFHQLEALSALSRFSRPTPLGKN